MLAACSNTFAGVLSFCPPPVGAGLPPGSEIRKGKPHRILQEPNSQSSAGIYQDAFALAELQHRHHLCSLDRDSTEIQALLKVRNEWITLFQKTKRVQWSCEGEALGVRISGTVGGIARPRDRMAAVIGLTAHVPPWQSSVSWKTGQRGEVSCVVLSL